MSSRLVEPALAARVVEHRVEPRRPVRAYRGPWRRVGRRPDPADTDPGRAIPVAMAGRRGPQRPVKVRWAERAFHVEAAAVVGVANRRVVLANIDDHREAPSRPPSARRALRKARLPSDERNLASV